MYLSRNTYYINAIKTSVRSFSTIKNHYEVLNLQRNCTDKDIKQAFIQMSKVYHPDMNKDKKAQEMFVRIVEAYNILGKPGSRALYDSTNGINRNNRYVYRSSNMSYNPNYSRKNPCYNSFYYQKNENTNFKNAQKNKETGQDSYYGFPGIKRIPNSYIITICFGVAFVGVLIQLIMIRSLYVAQRAKAQEKSMLLAEELNKIQTTARDNGNELQTRLLLEKIVTAANPTITTASLGQALASEKK